MNKSHPKSLPAMAVRVDIVRPRDERLELPAVKGDWRLMVAAICLGVSIAGLVLGAVLVIVWP